ncbi:site-specific recombinase XerD [Pontibacter ummariensis]|uniref:Site-specific recombinase XerD n=1 Tax=Pontibacter ummariensis TaxID=1610492 RepID=A0A239DD03_9BACT|nr:site-specific integrase [Pontibacter ummariensis]PRY14368.1 site-specific recombinase XerD [Pontibacter ummariensis]SNS30306.1 Site-specific recombinase XerD [Pontibacter ummariensis]
MTLNYYLDKPKSETDTAIYLYMRVGTHTIKLKTGQYINPRYWNTKADKNGNHVKRNYTGSPEFNGWLDSHKKDLHKLYNKLTEERDLSIPELREAVNGFFEKKQPSEAMDFFEHLQEYIDISATERSKGTITKYKVFLKQLKAFSEKYRYRITFDTIDLRFFDLFKTYLQQVLKHTDNTLWKDFTTLKTFMAWAMERGLHQNLAFKKFKAPQKDVEIIYLTEKELMMLYDAKIPVGSKLDKVRDVFCFGCFTGQRYSDIANLKHSDIKGDKWVLRTVKTDRAHQVPLNGFALAILEKYKDAPKPLPVMSNQKTNDYLKDLGELVGINEPTTLTKRRGNEKLVNSQPKYEFISTHTARRTFITLSLEKGMRPEVVMRISGHTNYATFKKYIKISEKVAEQEMNSIWQLPVQMKVVS